MKSLLYLLVAFLLLVPAVALAQTDSDGDGVDDAADLCNGVDASFFDMDGDGCIDPTAHARHREFWDPADLPLRFVIHENGAPGIGGDADLLAVQAGFEAWTVLPGVSLSATYDGTTTQAAADGMDGVNLVTFEDPEFLAVYGSAVLAVGITTSYDVPTDRGDGTVLRPGQIFDADMIFNPVRSFSTDGAGIDLASVATHEAGHLFGIAHSAVQGSTMFPALPAGTRARSLEAEDILVAFMSSPDPAALAGATELSGTVRDGSDLSPIGGAAVFAISASTGDTLGCQYTLADGSWRFVGLEPGSYLVSIAPLEGASANGVVPALVNAYVEAIATNLVWPVEFWDAAESASDDPLASDPIFLSSGATVAGIDLVTNVDLEAPTLVEFAPESGSPIRSDALFFLRFSEDMDFASATTSVSFSRVDGANRILLPFGLVQVDGDVFVIDPATLLDFDAEYEMVVSGTITDRSGNPLGIEIVRTFTTGPAPPLGITTVVPSSVVEGAVVLVYGEGFDESDPAANLVRFGGIEVPATTVSRNALSATVPAGLPTGDFELSVVVGAQTSASLPMAKVDPVDVVRGTDYATMQLAGVPADIALLPDGNFAYVATSTGLAVASTGLAASDFGTHEDLFLSSGVADLAVAPGGRRVYAVSRTEDRIFVIDSDYGDLELRNPTFNSVIAELETGATPTGIALDPAGERAYVATDAGTIEVWDIEAGSATRYLRVGVLASPVPSLTGDLAVDPRAESLFALTGSGELLVFDLADPAAAPVQEFVGGSPKDIELDPRGLVAYVTDADGTVSVVQLATGTTTQVIDVGGSPRGFTVDPTATRGWIANRANDEIQVLDLMDGSPSFRTVTSTVSTGSLPVDVAVLPDGLFILSAEAGSRALRLIGIGAGPQLTGIVPVAGRPGDWFVISGSGFAPTGEGLLSALEYFASGMEERPSTRVWFGDIEVRPLSATVDRVAVQAPDGWAGEPVRVAWNGPEVQGQPTALFSNAVTPRLLPASPADFSETVDRAVFMGEDNGYAWATPGVSGALAVSPTGDFLLVGDQEDRLYFVDLDANGDQGQVVGDMTLSASPRSGAIVVAPDGRRAWYSGLDDLVHEIDTDPSSPSFLTEVGVLTDESGAPPSIQPGDLHVTGSGNLLVVEDLAGGGLCTFRIQGEAPHDFDYPVFSEPDGVPQASSVHPSGLWAVYATEDQLLRVSLNENRLVFGSRTGSMGVDGTPLDLAFTPGGEALAVVYWTPDDGGSYWLQLRLPWLMSQFLFRPQSLHQLVSGVGPGEAALQASPRGGRLIVDVPAADAIFYADVSRARWGIIDEVRALERGSLASRMAIGFDPLALGVFLSGEGDSGVEFRDFANSTGGAFVSGLGQTGVAGETLPLPVRYRVVDDQGNPSAGAVAEVYAEGGGTLGNGGAYQWLATNPDGVISIEWTMGPDVDGDPASPANNLRVTLNGGAVLAEDVGVPSVEDPQTQPLRLVELRPADGAAGVSLGTTILARFSRAIDRTTAVSPDYLLRRADDQSVVGAARGFADGNRSASLVPQAALLPSTTYEIVLTADVLDDEGGPLGNPVVATFTTEDLPALSISSISPASAVPGLEVVIAGTCFGDDPDAVTVDFNGTVVPASGGTDEFVTAYVPVGAVTGPVRVEVGAQQSNPISFSVLLPVATPLDQVVTTVETGSPVQSLAVTPDGSKAYSVNSQVDAVVPVNMLTFALGTPIQVGSAPSGIAIHPNGGTAYVANSGSGTVSVIDVATDSVIETIDVGSSPRDIVASPNGAWLYVIDSVDRILSVIDVDGSSAAYHTVVATAPTTRSTKGAAIRPDGSLLYLGTSDGYLIFDLEPSAYGVVAAVPTGSSTKGAAIRPDGSLLFLLTASNEVLVVDVSQGGSNAVVASVETDANATAAAISPDGSRLFLLQEGSAEVYVYDIIVEYNVSSTAAIGSITVRTVLVNVIAVPPDPGVIAIDPSGSGIVVIGHGTSDGLLTFLNSSSYLRAPILADMEPDPVALDPVWGGRAFVFRLCLPEGLDVGGVDASSLLLQGSVGVLPGSERIETDPATGRPCLVVGFDRLAMQALIPPPTASRQVQPPEGYFVFGLTGRYGAESQGISATVFVSQQRATLDKPEAGDGFWPGRPMHIVWITPPGVQASSVDIRFSENGGRVWYPIVEGLPNDGDQWISSPGGVSVEALIEVVFRDTTGAITAIAIPEGFLRLDEKAVPVAMGDVQLGVVGSTGLLEWSVADAQALDGFHVLRSLDEEGTYEQVNTDVVRPGYGPDGATFEFADEGILGNRAYFYKLQEVRPDGSGFVHGPYRLTWSLRNELKQNVPNSFNPRTTISFSTATDGKVRLAVYTLSGRLVDVLVEEHLRANTYDVVWEGRDRHGRQVASGVYLYRLTAPGFSAARKMALVR